MNSKKYEEERKKSPIMKNSEISKPPIGKHIMKPKNSHLSMVQQELNHGFYMKNKPVRSPNTPSSSNKSNGFLGSNKFGHK